MIPEVSREKEALAVAVLSMSEETKEKPEGGTAPKAKRQLYKTIIEATVKVAKQNRVLKATARLLSVHRNTLRNHHKNAGERFVRLYKRKSRKDSIPQNLGKEQCVSFFACDNGTIRVAVN